MHLGITHLVIESDYQIVINKLQDEDPISEFGNLLYDIKE